MISSENEKLQITGSSYTVAQYGQKTHNKIIKLIFFSFDLADEIKKNEEKFSFCRLFYMYPAEENFPKWEIKVSKFAIKQSPDD